MGLSIFLQNAALMLMTADLLDVPPIFSHSVTIGPFYFKVELLLGFLITILSTVGLQWMIRTTYLGKAIRATVQDSEAAMLMGIPVPRIFLITFAGGSALVGLAACVMLPLFSVFPTVGLNFVLIAFVIACWRDGSIEARCSAAFMSASCNHLAVTMSLRPWANVLLYCVPARDDLPTERTARQKGVRQPSMKTIDHQCPRRNTII